MASMGGSAWGSSSQPRISSPFGAANPFATPSQSSVTAQSQFAQPRDGFSGSQATGGAAAYNPFAAASQQTQPPIESGSQPNPFSVFPPAADKPFKNPFGQNQQSAQPASASSPFFQPNNQSQTPHNPFATASSSLKPQPSPFGTFGTPSTLGSANAFPAGPQALSPNILKPSGRGNTRSPSPFGTPSGGFNATSEEQEQEPSFGLDGSGDARWAKRKGKKQFPEVTNLSAKRKGTQTFDGSTSDDNRKRNNQEDQARKRKSPERVVQTTSGIGSGPKKIRPDVKGPAKPQNGVFGSHQVDDDHVAVVAQAMSNQSHRQNSPYAKAIYNQLQKDNLAPPKWPLDPGNPNQKAAMAAFKADFKTFRDRARTSLIRGGLIDDPDKPKKLEDAIDFKGICEDMCPEYEKVTRITELDVQYAEKDSRTTFASTPRMIKKLARSAAGQEAPLPMDVRSTAALRRTLDYLINDLLRSDQNLPTLHGFLWDRTRAIRRDFVFHSTMSPEEMKDQVYCLETITRFHVTALHLLSQKGFAPEDFSEQQEIEQLGKSLLSLMFAYDDCKPQGIVCENEAEFRAYHLLYSGNTPNILDNVQKEWGDPRFWKDSDDIRTAVSLVEALQNIVDLHGPLGRGPSLAASSAYNSYFRIVEDVKVSYTMACFAEIHFGQLRRSILQALKKAYARPRGGPKDIAPAVLNKFLRFDTEDEAIDFVEQHGLTFIENEDAPGDISRSSLDTSDRFDYARLHHTFSKNLVEKKRGNELLPAVMHHNVFDSSSSVADVAPEESNDSLFVSGSEVSKPSSKHVRFSAPENNHAETLPTFPKSMLPTNESGLSNGSWSQNKETTNSGMNDDKPSAFSSPFTAFKSPTTGVSSNPSTTPATLPASSWSNPAGIPNPVKETPATRNPFPLATPLNGNMATPGASMNAAAPSLTNTGIQEQRPFVNGEQPNNLGSTQPQLPPKSNAGTAPAIFVTAPTAQFPTPDTSAVQNSNPFASLANAKPTTGPSFAAKPELSGQTPIQSAGASLSGGIPTWKPSGGPPQTQTPSLSGQAGTTSLSPLPASKPFDFPSLSQPIGAPTSQIPSKSLEQDTKTRESFSSRENSVTKEAHPSLSFPGLSAKSSTALPPAAQLPNKDRMGDFTRWFVTGDGGLMQEFEMFAVEQIVRDAYEQFIRDEEDKKRREEDEKALAEARKFQVYNLSVKYFYRWRENARKLRLSKIRRKEREEYRAAQATKRAAEIAAKRKAAKAAEARLQALKRDGVDPVEEFRDLLGLRKDSLQLEAEAILATGILSGVSNERAAAASIVRRERVISNEEPQFSAKQPAHRNINESLSQSMSTAKPGGSKTRTLREEFSGNAHNFRRSLPPMSSQSSSSRFTSPTERPKRVSKVSDRWRLKAMGLVTMPNGTALPESMANAMRYDGKRYPGLGSFGLDTSERRIRSVSAELQQAVAARHRFSQSLGSNVINSQANGDSPLQKRKRVVEDEGNELITNGAPQPDTKKRAPSNDKIDKIIEEARENLRALRHSRADLDEGADWFREQNERMQGESISRGSSPWARG